MKLRLEGLEEECRTLVAILANRLPDVLEVDEISRPYPNRGDSRKVRVYIDVRISEEAMK